MKDLEYGKGYKYPTTKPTRSPTCHACRPRSKAEVL